MYFLEILRCCHFNWRNNELWLFLLELFFVRPCISISPPYPPYPWPKRIWLSRFISFFYEIHHGNPSSLGRSLTNRPSGAIDTAIFLLSLEGRLHLRFWYCKVFLVISNTFWGKALWWSEHSNINKQQTWLFPFDLKLTYWRTLHSLNLKLSFFFWDDAKTPEAFSLKLYFEANFSKKCHCTICMTLPEQQLPIKIFSR